MAATVSDCEELRRMLKPIAERIYALHDGLDLDVPSEVDENLMIVYRHLKDASMRLGKTIQALDGGINVYDKTQVPTSAA